MAVLTSQGFNLQPDILGSLERGEQVVANRLGREEQQRQIAQQRQLGEQQQQATKLSGQILGPTPTGGRISPEQENQALAELFTVDPSAGLKIQEQLGIRDKKSLDEAANFAFEAEGLPPARQDQLIRQRVQALDSQGRDSSDTRSLLELSPEERSQALRTVQLLALPQEQRLKVARGEPLTSQQREFASLTEDLTSEDVTKAQRIKLGLDPRAVGVKTIKIAGVDHVFDPTTQKFTRIEIAGEEITADTVARDKAKIEKTIASAKGQAQLSNKIIGKGFETIGKIRGNIRNIDRALDALSRGAGTGFVESFFPSMKSASIELDRVQKELGLDVVGAVTFGALSKGELDLALSTALPLNLNEPQLKDWLERKRDSQNKLSDYFTEQINFFEGGGTVGEFLQQQKQTQQASQIDVQSISDDELFK